jgi:hypothetical protein
VADLGDTFVDGEAEVTDKTTIEALRRLHAELGVRCWRAASEGPHPPP